MKKTIFWTRYADSNCYGKKKSLGFHFQQLKFLWICISIYLLDNYQQSTCLVYVFSIVSIGNLRKKIIEKLSTTFFLCHFWFSNKSVAGHVRGYIHLYRNRRWVFIFFLFPQLAMEDNNSQASSPASTTEGKPIRCKGLSSSLHFSIFTSQKLFNSDLINITAFSEFLFVAKLQPRFLEKPVSHWWSKR